METAGSTSERGIGWQALGFAVVGCAGVAILELWSESGSWVYQSFETAAIRLYWAFVVPLAALFDWGPRMFDASGDQEGFAVERSIRNSVEKAVKKAIEDERRRLRERIATWNMPAAEVERQLFSRDRPEFSARCLPVLGVRGSARGAVRFGGEGCSRRVEAIRRAAVEKADRKRGRKELDKAVREGARRRKPSGSLRAHRRDLECDRCGGREAALRPGPALSCRRSSRLYWAVAVSARGAVRAVLSRQRPARSARAASSRPRSSG